MSRPAQEPAGQRVAVISGAVGGIGRALCDRFASDGYRVVATDRDAADGIIGVDLERFCRDDGYRHQALGSLNAAVGDGPLTVLINNAAVQILGGVESLQPSDLHTTLDVNLVAPFLLSQAFLSELEAARGSIINVGSIHSRLTKRNFVAYATSKAALEGMTRAMAVDLGGRVRVNGIAPAATATEMLEAGFEGKAQARAALDAAHPAGRIAAPSEVAELALFLASDRSSFMSGSVVGIDGGIAARLHDPD